MAPTSPSVLAGAPLLIAHRGGAGLAPENTLAAFRQAVDDWDADMIELDVHATADGECVVIHDPTVDRTTDGTGPVAAMTLAELKLLDAGYRFTPDGGKTFPFRGQGVRIPTIAEVLDALPDARLTVELKTGAAQRPLFEAIRRAGAEGRVIAAGERTASRTLFREYTGAASASSRQMMRFLVLYRLGLHRLWRAPVVAVQIPETWKGRQLLTARMVRALHARGLAVHIWTVNEVADMERLLDWGVDGIVTDRPDRLADILTARGMRPPAPARRRVEVPGSETAPREGARREEAKLE
jgi:glycerophosphoryl diester phosphodiesterase